MASAMSITSWFSVSAASGVTSTPPVPESRPSIDSSGSRQWVDTMRPIGSGQEQIRRGRGSIRRTRCRRC